MDDELAALRRAVKLQPEALLPTLQLAGACERVGMIGDAWTALQSLRDWFARDDDGTGRKVDAAMGELAARRPAEVLAHLRVARSQGRSLAALVRARELPVVIALACEGSEVALQRLHDRAVPKLQAIANNFDPLPYPEKLRELLAWERHARELLDSGWRKPEGTIGGIDAGWQPVYTPRFGLAFVAFVRKAPELIPWLPSLRVVRDQAVVDAARAAFVELTGRAEPPVDVGLLSGRVPRPGN